MLWVSGTSGLLGDRTGLWCVGWSWATRLLLNLSMYDGAELAGNLVDQPDTEAALTACRLAPPEKVSMELATPAPNHHRTGG
jgi:hypothetical protein